MSNEDYKIAYENVLVANKMLEKENKRLKALCDKYEEEHETTFKEWQKDIEANKEAIDYIKTNCILSDVWKDLGFCDFVPIGKIEYKTLSSKKVKCLLDILKRVDKE